MTKTTNKTALQKQKSDIIDYYIYGGGAILFLPTVWTIFQDPGKVLDPGSTRAGHIFAQSAIIVIIAIGALLMNYGYKQKYNLTLAKTATNTFFTFVLGFFLCLEIGLISFAMGIRT